MEASTALLLWTGDHALYLFLCVLCLFKQTVTFKSREKESIVQVMGTRFVISAVERNSLFLCWHLVSAIEVRRRDTKKSDKQTSSSPLT